MLGKPMLYAGFAGQAIQENQHGESAQHLGEFYQEATEKEFGNSGWLLPMVEYHFIADAKNQIYDGQKQQMTPVSDNGKSGVSPLHGEAEVEVEEEIGHAAYSYGEGAR